MKNTKKTILIIFAVIFSIAPTVFLPPKKASAYSEENLAWKKAIGIAIRDCYTKGVMKSPITMEDYNFSGNTFSFSDEMTIIPNLNGNERAIKCYELFKRYIKDSDWPTTTIESKRDFFVNKLGYTETKNKSSGKCFRFGYDYEFDSESDWLGDGKEIKRLEDVATDYICAEFIDENGIINVDRMKIEDSNEERGKNKWAGSSFNVEWENHDGYIQADCWVQNVDWFRDRDITKPVRFIKGETKWNDFKEELAETLRTTKACTATRHSLMEYTAYLRPNAIDIHEKTYDDMFAEFKIEDPSKAATKAIKTMVGFSWSTNPRFSKTDTFSLYQAYATEYYKSDIVCSTKEKPMTDEEKTVKKTQGYIPIAVFSNGSMQSDCFARATENSGSLSTGAEGDHYGEDRTFEEICAWLAKNYKDVYTNALEIVETKNQESNPSNPDGKKDEAEPAKSEAELLNEGCYRHAKSLGWILCPVIFGLHEVSEGVYKMVEPLLQVNEKIVEQLGDQNGAIFKTWSTFRNFANIVFAIIFLIIIFSQLTGYGIDNYGIKKTLPKLIITIILVNLSFIICAIAVDISNIVGTSIKGLFESLGGGNLGGNAIGAQSLINKEIIATLVVGGTAAATGVAGALTAKAALATGFGGWALIAPILLLLLTTAVSIIFALIVLGLRQALVVVLIVSSPLAIIFSALPNTKAIYNRWFSLFKGALMVYPVIGTLVGVGYFTATIIYSGEHGFIMGLVAGFLTVAPYFMIPSVTRKALDAVGSLGTKVNSLGKGLSGRINNSEKAKNIKDTGIAARANARANRYLASKRGKKDIAAVRGGTANVVQANRLKRALGSTNAMRSANLDAISALNSHERMAGRGYEAARVALDMQREKTDLDDARNLSADSIAARRAGIQDADFEAQVKDSDALFQNSNVYDDDALFEREVESALKNNETSKLEALLRKAEKGTDKQRTAVRNAWNNAVTSGTGIKEDSARAFARSMNSGVYKEKDRSMNRLGSEVMNAVSNAGPGGVIRSNGSDSLVSSTHASYGVLAGKQSASAAFGLDDSEFDEMIKRANTTTDVNERERLAQFASEALYLKENDATGQYDEIKPETIDQLRKLKAAATGDASYLDRGNGQGTVNFSLSSGRTNAANAITLNTGRGAIANKDYVPKDNETTIVDEATGQVMFRIKR